MQYSIGLQLPSEFTENAVGFCANYQFDLQEPYIFLAAGDQVENVVGLEHKLQSFCLAQADFKIVIAGPSCYSDQMLYLTVLPGKLNMMRDKLIRYLKLPPDTQAYRPHLPLIKQGQDGVQYDLNAILEDAKTVFVKSHSFEMNSMTLFSRQYDTFPYKPQMVIQFTGR